MAQDNNHPTLNSTGDYLFGRFSPLLRFLWLCALLPSSVQATEFGFRLEMSQVESGNYYVKGRLDNEGDLDFLVDTGSGLVILSETVFNQLPKHKKPQPVSRKAARMADGRTKAIEVYKFDQLTLGDHCQIGPVEVAVIPGATRNILGLSALNQTAPFAIYTSPPTLALTGCLLPETDAIHSD